MDEKTTIVEEVVRHPLTWLFSGGGLTLLVNNFFARRKAVAEAKQVDAGAEVVLSQGAIQFANELRKDIDLLQKRVGELERENRALFQRVTELESDGREKDRRIAHLEQDLAARETEIASLKSKLSTPVIP